MKAHSIPLNDLIHDAHESMGYDAQVQTKYGMADELRSAQARLFRLSTPEGNFTLSLDGHPRKE